MPIYNTPLVNIDKEETRRYAGLRGEAAFPEQLLEQACSEALVYTKPRGCWQVYPYDAKTATIIGQTLFRPVGNSIIRHLVNAVEVAILAVSIGPDLEEAAASHFAGGEYTTGLLLDAAGTTAVETTTDTVNNLIASQASRRGLTALTRFSPGYGDWDITDQPHILALAGGNQINITVTPSCMLLPRKSVTAIVGLQPSRISAPVKVCRAESCKACSLPNCSVRKENGK